MRLRLLSILFLCVVASSCARVAPWERDLLAEQDMLLDSNAIERDADEHIYFSKEASSGGYGFGGGGCGCN